MAAPLTREISVSTESRSYLSEVAAAFPDELRLGREPAAIDWVAHEFYSTADGKLSEIKNVGKTACSDLIIVTGSNVAGAAGTPDTYPQPASLTLHSFDIEHLLLVMRAGGRPYGYPGLRNGCVTTDIFPQNKYADVAGSGLSSRTPLGWHIDNALNPALKPDWISLLAVRNLERAPTVTAAVNDSDLSAAALEMLKQPIFTLGGNTGHSVVMPIIGEVDIDGRCILNNAGTGDITIAADDTTEREAKQALQELGTVLDDPDNQTEVTLEPGQVLLLNNRRQVHGRLSFEPHADQRKRRWLHRYYLKLDAMDSGFNSYESYIDLT